MLHDNSQLSHVYLHGWQVTGHQFFRAITEEILDYVMHEMTDPVWGFYSTQVHPRRRPHSASLRGRSQRGRGGQVLCLEARRDLGFAQWLIAQDYVLAHPREVSIIGSAEAADTQALLDGCITGYRPHQIIALGEPGADPVTVPILEGGGLIDGRASAYVCVDCVCQRPVIELEELLELIE